MASRDTSFYYSFLVLPPRKRQAVLAVWDFCRAVDDAVDEVETDWQRGLTPEARARAEESLAVWRDELDRIFGGIPMTPQGKSLQPWVSEFNLPKREFSSLIDGVEMDLTYVKYPDFEALSTYCHKVASSVGSSAWRSSATEIPERATTPSTSASRCSSRTSSATWPAT